MAGMPLKRIAVTLLVSVVTVSPDNAGSTEIHAPGAVTNIAAGSATMRGVTVGAITAPAGTVARYVLRAGASLPATTETCERVLIVTNGGVTVTAKETSHTVVEGSFFVESGCAAAVTATSDGAELMAVVFRSDPADVAAKSCVETGIPISFDHLQFCYPVENLETRIIRCRGGLVCLARFLRGKTYPASSMATPRLAVVMRGAMDATVDGAPCGLERFDTLYLPAGMAFYGEPGPRGCNMLMVTGPGESEFTRALDRRLAALATIADPAEVPVLLIDGAQEPTGLTFTEGPSWMNNRLYFSNYYKYWKPWGSSDEGGIWFWEPGTGDHGVLNKNVQTCGTTPLPNGNLAVCDLFKRGVVEMAPDGTMLGTIVDSYGGIPFAVANDVITDRKGGLYVTDSSVAKEGQAQPGTALYYRAADGTVTRVTDPGAVEYINGVVVTANDRTLFLNGSGEMYVWMFDVAPDGTLSNRRPFARLRVPDAQLEKEKPSSTADGMTMDADGRIYVATALGIQVFEPDGTFTGVLTFPQKPSHCVFGGENLSTLFCTCSDRIYARELKVKGVQYPLPPLE